MHISSLPSPYGIGTLGQAAYDFADFLKAAGQHYWQLLPIGPTTAPIRASARTRATPISLTSICCGRTAS